MPAHVHERSEIAVLVARDQDRHTSGLYRQKVTRLGQLVFQPGELPGTAKDLFLFFPVEIGFGIPIRRQRTTRFEALLECDVGFDGNLLRELYSTTPSFTRFCHGYRSALRFRPLPTIIGRHERGGICETAGLQTACRGAMPSPSEMQDRTCLR
jgi:hypothetical protein